MLQRVMKHKLRHEHGGHGTNTNIKTRLNTHTFPLPS